MTFRETLKFVARFSLLLLRPVLLYNYVRAGRMLRHRMIQAQAAELLEVNDACNRKFEAAASLLEDAAKSSPKSTSVELARAVIEGHRKSMSPEDAARKSEEQMGKLFWLHPARVYNQLIEYDPSDPRIREADAHDPVEVAKIVYSLRQESSNVEPRHVG